MALLVIGANGDLAMIAVLGALVLVSAYDPDVVITNSRPGAGAVPVTSEPIQTESPALTVSTAAHGLDTQQQISRWLDDRAPVEDAPIWRDQEPRRVTGEVSLGIGSGDYSHASGYVTLPLGENGTLSLGYSQTKNGWMQRPMGVDGMFWSPYDEVLGPQWVTATGRSYSPLGHGRTRIERPYADREPSRDTAD